MAGVGDAGLDTGDFVVGERVFVPHVDRHYEAKVLKAEFRRNAELPDGQWYYFLHYSGWNKKYDEWVEGSGLVKAAELGLAAGGTGAATAGGAKGGGAKKAPKERFAAVDLMNWVAEQLDSLLAPRETYLDYHTVMAGLTGAGGAAAEAVAAAGYTTANVAPPGRAAGAAAAQAVA
ncbi:hypothetical protein GPECTOR_16g535 [Gonium pectorale]|uniref:Tudor-knot domain-containing protein n=1 Tax=Gonium pectorale TaxID=33097 RepID=A0A150GKN1_GONPE|nr:hypothetical protein GPECTOR_16g535 [Gonium pectorale]|eukprot:KXZ50362.1 hypothetical protein GPECTOR_16g535 [Gonium pectorale]